MAETKKKGFLASLLSDLPDIISAGAQGYAAGAGNSNIPEAAAARGLATGIESGKKAKEDSRIKLALDTYRASPEYQTMDEREKAQFESHPTEFFSHAAERTVSLPTRLFNPDADESDTIDVPIKTAAQFLRKAKGTGSTPAGQRLLSPFATREIYRKLKKTPQEIEALPQQMTVDDARMIIPRSPLFDFTGEDGGPDAGVEPTPPESAGGFLKRLMGSRGQKITKDQAAKMLEIVGNDKTKAEALAKALGLQFE